MRMLKWLMPFSLALLLMACSSSNSARGEEKDEGPEVKVNLADVPAAVKATLNRESNNASLDEVEKETEDGKTVYEADAKMNGKNYEIKVAADGTLISKKLDEDDEKGEAHEGNEKNDKD
jgi:hypothetical protein